MAPRGELELRREIADYLAIARGIDCSPSQIIVTCGYSAGLGLTLRVLGVEGEKVWIEDPGLPFTRKGLELAHVSLAPIPVDANGIDIDHELRHAPDAKLVVVTPGQQAPLGPALSLDRRLKLLDCAAASGAWIIEDDYLSELQLTGRAAPALASLDRAGRVIHVGSFSKTISPTLRLGFVVAPIGLIARFAEVAACLAPPPGPAVQFATAKFMREGRYLRHLRRTKRVYAAKRGRLAGHTAAPFRRRSRHDEGLAVLAVSRRHVGSRHSARDAAFRHVSGSALGLVCLCADQPVWALVGRFDIADKGTREILRPLGRRHPALQLTLWRLR